MKISDLLAFQRQNYFNGAVQTEWFYQEDKRKAIAESYVFHGPQYYGVSEKDLQNTQHRLLDTASFAAHLARKLHAEQVENYFTMTIAGYGCGKSHLAVTLGALFSHLQGSAEIITEHIRRADAAIADDIAHVNTKPNLVIALNGMNNFNLDYEVLHCAKEALRMHGVSQEVLQKLNKAHTLGKRFVERSFALCQAQFCELLRMPSLDATQAKAYILQHIDSDAAIFTIVNTVYQQVNGEAIPWERGIAAGDILQALSSELCGKGKPFHKILILFDEFGRFIEYAAANPTTAGQAALQQIFEAAQNASGKILFVGFIQSSLTSYLSRIEKTANIVRYVGRYEASEKLYLSSNFETILANLIAKKDAVQFKNHIGFVLNKRETFYKRMHDTICRWDTTPVKKAVWKNWSLYQKVILEGCYPMHPLSVWFLANTSNWMQQRSTITFAAEMFDRFAERTLRDGTLPCILPIDIVDSNIYSEMLNAEEKGLMQSQYCMLYREIMTKVGDKLTPIESKVLKAILISNICKFAFYNQEDALLCLRYCTSQPEEDLLPALKVLENEHGVIAFDAHANTFDLIAEANGFHEFKRTLMKYQIRTPISIESFDDEVATELSLQRAVETSFAQEHHISAWEWQFSRYLVDIRSITPSYLRQTVQDMARDYAREQSNGRLVYVYATNDTIGEMERVQHLIGETQADKRAIIFLLLHDPDGDMLDLFRMRAMLQKFSSSDFARFQKHVVSQKKAGLKKMVQRFTQLSVQRKMLTKTGIVSFDTRLNALCTAKFAEMYPQAPMFAFDGFEKKTTVQARKYLSNICIKLFDRTLTNPQSYHALTQDEKNRVRATLSVDSKTSWKVFTEMCTLQVPQDTIMRHMYETVDGKLQEEKPLSIWPILEPFTQPPYGMNLQQITLFLFYFMAQNAKNITCFYGTENLSANHVNEKLLKQNKISLASLQTIKIQKNAKGRADRVEELCQQILQLRYVEDCARMQQELQQMTLQYGVTVENELLVAQAKMRLEEGQKLSSKMDQQLQDMRDTIASAQESLVLHKFIKVFKLLPADVEKIEPYTTFSYQDCYLQQIASIKMEIDTILQEQCQQALQKFTCKITQLSQVKSAYKGVAQTLSQNGYVQYAEQVQARMSELEQELLARQKYDAILVSCENDIKILQKARYFTWVDGCNALEKLQQWRDTLDVEVDLPASIHEKMQVKLEKAQASVQKYCDTMQKQCTQALSHYAQASNADMLRKASASLTAVQAFQMPEDITNSITQAQENIAQAQALLSYTTDSVQKLQQKILEVEAWDTPCKQAVLRTYQAQLADLRKKETRWVAKYLSMSDAALQKMKAKDCIAWKDETDRLPKYLGESTIQRYHAVRKIIAKQLAHCRVEGVLALFQDLTEEEKAECLQRLHGIR